MILSRPLPCPATALSHRYVDYENGQEKFSVVYDAETHDTAIHDGTTIELIWGEMADDDDWWIS